MNSAARTASMVVVALAAAAGQAMGQTVSIKLTTNALGLGSAAWNDGNTVDPDAPGKLVTSPTTGEGSILTVQRSGLAGGGTLVDPLLVRITAHTHLDLTAFPANFPSNHDVHAGIIYLTNENTGLPDGRDEGLGVRAFTVGESGAGLGLRRFSGGLAMIEGSKEVSGGTDGPEWSGNGAPHVDEDAIFDFDAGSPVAANSVVVRFSKMEVTDRMDLHILLTGGGTLDYLFLGTAAMSNPGDSVWDLAFANLAGVTAGQQVDSFSVRAIDDDPAHPSGTAEHFLITGFSGNVVPAPGCAALLAVGGALLLRRRR